jgi:hypothetical protein
LPDVQAVGKALRALDPPAWLEKPGTEDGAGPQLSGREHVMNEAMTTTDRETIRNWVEARGGKPARVQTPDDGVVLRIEFGAPDRSSEAISWREFFRIFEENDLVFLRQDWDQDGGISRSHTLIDRKSQRHEAEIPRPSRVPMAAAWRWSVAAVVMLTGGAIVIYLTQVV